MWGLFHDPPLPRGARGVSTSFHSCDNLSKRVTARNALCVKGQADTQDWKYQKPVLTDSRRGQGHKGAPQPVERRWGSGGREGAKQLQTGTRSMEQISSTLWPVQDGEQEGQGCPPWVEVSGPVSALAPARGRVQTRVCAAHLHRSLLAPSTEGDFNMTPHPSPQCQATHTAE